MELKPCPFCGGAADIVRVPGIVGGAGKWSAFCTAQDCPADMQGPTKERAVESWNRRPAAVEQEVLWRGYVAMDGNKPAQSLALVPAIDNTGQSVLYESIPVFLVRASATVAPPRRVIDGKFHVEGSKIIKTASGEEVPEDEALLLVRGRDRLALPMLYHYRELCRMDGCNNYQMQKVVEIIARFEEYARTHPTKQPGMTRGAPWTPPVAPPDERQEGEALPGTVAEMDGFVCDCGATASSKTTDPAFRWAGDHWQHHHGYPTGHVSMFRVAPQPSGEGSFEAWNEANPPLDYLECDHEEGYHEPDTNAFICRRCEEMPIEEIIAKVAARERRRAYAAGRGEGGKR